MTIRCLILVALPLVGLCSAAQAQARAAAPPTTQLSLETLTPRANQTYNFNVGFSARLHNPPEKRLKVRISCYGVTHHLLLEPKPLAQRRGPRDQFLEIIDGYLPATPGPATLRLRIWPADEPAAFLVDQEIPFTVQKPAAIDPSSAWQYRAVYPPVVLELERRYRSLVAQARTDPLAQEKLPAVADLLWTERINEFRQRLNAMSNLAMAHAAALDPDRALACLERAEAIFKAEQAALNQHPLKGQMDWRGHPQADSSTYFMSTFSLLYGRYGHLDEAVQWQQAQAEYHRARWVASQDSNVKRSATYAEANAYAQIAFLHLLLKDDMAAYTEWMQKSRTVQAEVRGMSP